MPPIPRLASPLPDKVELTMLRWRNEECKDTRSSDGDRKLVTDLSELNVDEEDVDQEEVGLKMTKHTSNS